MMHISCNTNMHHEIELFITTMVKKEIKRC